MRAWVASCKKDGALGYNAAARHSGYLCVRENVQVFGCIYFWFSFPSFFVPGGVQTLLTSPRLPSQKNEKQNEKIINKYINTRSKMGEKMKNEKDRKMAVSRTQRELESRARKLRAKALRRCARRAAPLMSPIGDGTQLVQIISAWPLWQGRNERLKKC